MTRHRRPTTVLAATMFASLAALTACATNAGPVAPVQVQVQVQVQPLDAATLSLIPRPVSLQPGHGHYTVNAGTGIHADGEAARRVATQFIKVLLCRLYHNHSL